MNIRNKAVLALLVVSVLMVGAVGLGLRTLLDRGFAELEQQEVHAKVAQARKSLIDDYLEFLDAKVVDWSMWSEVYEFIVDPDPDFIDINTHPAWFERAGIDFVIFLDGSRRVVGSRSINRAIGVVGPPDSEVVAAVLAVDSLGTFVNESQSVGGLLSIGDRMVLVSARPSLDDEGRGPVHGAVVMGRELDSSHLRRIAEQVGVIGLELTADIPGSVVDAGSFSAGAGRSREIGSGVQVIPEIRPGEVGGVLHFSTLHMGETCELSIRFARSLWQQGREITGWLSMVAIAAILVVGMALLMIIEFSVIRRIRRLRDEVESIHDMGGPITEDGNDEVTSLATSFSGVFSRLRQAHDEVSQARDAAMSASQEKADLLSAVSHELRTPMNGVVGMARLLEETGLDAEQRELVGVIRASGEGLLSLVSDLLDMARIEAGRLELESIVFDLRTVLEEAAVIHSERAQSKGVDFAVVVSADTPRQVKGDPTRLRQIIHNLLGNAVKFTERGEVVFSVTPEGDSGGRFALRLVVRDTGIGISAGVQEHLFTRFFQGESTTNRRYGGAGLGLAITRQLVERMGGSIQLESETGRGAIFTVRILVGSAPSPEIEAFGGGRRVVVCDRHQATREGLRLTLTAFGFTVEEAGNIEAMKLLVSADSTPMAVILDVRCLPSETEPDIAVTDLGLGDVPVLVVTELGRRKGWKDRPGVAEVIARPVGSAQIREILARLVAGGVVGDGSGSRGRPGDGSGLRVLVVEDNLINQRVAAGMIRRLGARVDVADNGILGLEFRRRSAFDLVIVDCQMPLMDGYEMSQQWRTEEDVNRRSYLVALTADVSIGARDRCLAAGMDDYLSKPVRFEDLAKLVRRVMERRSAASGALPIIAGGGSVANEDEFDRAMLDQVRVLGEGGFRDVIDRYQDLLPQRFVALRQAMEGGDVARVAVLAHQLVGESGLMGLRRLSSLAKDVEISARSENRIRQDLLHLLEGAIGMGLVFLRRERDRAGDLPT